MKFNELYKKVIDACKAFDEKRIPIHLDFKIEDWRDALEESDAVIADLQKTNVMLADNAVKLNRELESLKASHYAESVDAGMENRRLKRALWLARAEIAKAMKAVENLDNYLSLHKNSKWFGIYATRIDTWYYKWDNVERKCRAKAEKFKE